MLFEQTYNKLYKENNYNDPVLTGNDVKWEYIKNCIPDDAKNAIDLGCGRGYYLRKLLGLGIDTIGVEFSKECCDTYLQDVQHYNLSISDYYKGWSVKTDLTLCIDVLEHVPVKDLKPIFLNMASTSVFTIMGIANHSDVQNGEELHVTCRPHWWWYRRLRSIFNLCLYDVTTFDRFYIFGGYPRA